MSLLEALSTFFASIVSALASINVPGFNFSFLSLFIGTFGFVMLISAISLILNFGGGGKKHD